MEEVFYLNILKVKNVFSLRLVSSIVIKLEKGFCSYCGRLMQASQDLYYLFNRICAKRGFDIYG